jgi:hypothetical protein
MWETKKSLQRELDNAEERVVFHYKRANKFERIIQKAIKTIELEQANKTPAVHIVDKIKKILANDSQSNN